MRKFYGVTAPSFKINRGFFSRPMPLYIGAKFTDLASDKKQEVTIFATENEAKEFAQSKKNDDHDRTVGIVTIAVLDKKLLNDLKDAKGMKISLDPQKTLLLAGLCPRLDKDCWYDMASPAKELKEKLFSDRPSTSQKIAEYFRYYYDGAGLLYKTFGLDHEKTAHDIVAVMEEKGAKQTDQEITAYLLDVMDKLLKESPANVSKAFYKTLAYAIAIIQDYNVVAPPSPRQFI